LKGIFMKKINHRGHGEHGVKDLKPALRELAARSQKLKEFAMVRDANGQFVEVEDEGGMGMGTAVKAGAGAAAIGGAGYGAYRGHNAVMGVGADEYAKKSAMAATAADRVGSTTPIAQRAANYKIAKAGAAGNFDRMGFMDKVKTGYGMAGQSAMNSAAGRSGLLGRLGRFALKLR
jgi:hypothetical protein